MGIEAIGKSFGSVIDERLSNPLVGGFVISWTAINWKLLVIIFSKNTVSETLKLADGLYKTPLDWWGWNVALPLAIALAYVYLLPLVSRPVHRQWRENQQAVEDDRQEVARLQRLEVSRSQEILTENFQLRQQVAEARVEREAAHDARKTALDEKITAELKRDAAEVDAAANHKRNTEVEALLKNAEEAIERLRRELANKRTALDQLTHLAIESISRVPPVGFTSEALHPINELILADLKARSMVSAEVEVPMLYVLWVLRSASPDGMSEEDIEKSVGEVLAGDATKVLVKRLALFGYLELRRATMRSKSFYDLTPAGRAVVIALEDYDQILAIPSVPHDGW